MHETTHAPEPVTTLTGAGSALGNRMTAHLLGSSGGAPRIQRKARDAQSTDAIENEADRAAEAAVPGAMQSLAAPPAGPGESGAGGSTSLIAEDDVTKLQPGQMRKSEFLAEVRAQVSTVADEGLKESGQTAKGCPWIEYWLSYYGGRDAAQVERALHKFAPGARQAGSARDYVPLIAARVRQGVDRYNKTGETPDLPDGFGSEMLGGGVLGAVGSLFFKARPGGARDPENPHHILDQLGSGQPLESGLRSKMETAFGTGFSRVRVHADQQAGALSDRLNARAFTIGDHVAFSPGEYEPGTLAGQALLAHELAHVVQQGGTQQEEPLTKSPENTGQLEEDADRSAFAVVSSLWNGAAGMGARVAPAIRSGLRLQRCEKSEHEKEVERLGNLQLGYMEQKRKDKEEQARKDAEEDAKKKGLPPPPTPPKVELADISKEDQQKHGLPASPTTEWDNADQKKWKEDAKKAWESVVASVKGTELEKVADKTNFNFDPVAALTGGFYAAQNGHTLTVGMSWVRFALADPKNVWENLAHEMSGHFDYGDTYASEIMDSALSHLSRSERKKVKGDPQKFFEAYEYPETEIFASLRQRKYRVPESGPERPSGGIHPDENIVKRLNVMKDDLQPDVAKAVIQELWRRVYADKLILSRDKLFFWDKVKEVFGYDPL